MRKPKRILAGFLSAVLFLSMGCSSAGISSNGSSDAPVSLLTGMLVDLVSIAWL